MNSNSNNIQMSGVSSPMLNSPAVMDDDNCAGYALSDFLLQLEDYSPTIPDSVVSHYLNMSGFESKDPRLVRLIAVAAQKFLSDVANDALQHCKTRSTNTSSHSSSKNPKGNKEKKYVMTMDDLVPALQEYGITARKPHYFV